MIQYFADWLVYEVFGLRAGTTWGTALNFFSQLYTLLYQRFCIIRVCALMKQKSELLL